MRFVFLIDQAGLPVAEVREIQRQRGDYKKAVKALENGDLEGGFAKLDELQAMHEVDGDDLYQQAAAEYVGQRIKSRDKTIVVSPTHQEIHKTTHEIRRQLKEAGVLGTKDRTVAIQRPLHFKDEQKTETRFYKPGHIVQFNQNVKGFRKSERVTVMQTNPDDIDGPSLTMQRRNGDTKRFGLSEQNPDHFSVYEASEFDLARGDLIRITRSGRSKNRHRLDNGSIYEVKGVTARGDIKLANGWMIHRDFANIAHGYCATSHTAQSMTVGNVIVVQGEASAGASNIEQFYVSVSRGRNKVSIYTDDREQLMDAASRSGQRLSATELVQGQDHRRQIERSGSKGQRTRGLARDMTDTAADQIRRRNIERRDDNDRFDERELGFER